MSNQDILDKGRLLVGQKVKLLVTPKDYVYRGVKYDMTSYVIDDPEMESKMRACAYNVRIKTPGTVWTQDYLMNRLNFKIDKDGIITDVYLG